MFLYRERVNMRVTRRTMIGSAAAASMFPKSDPLFAESVGLRTLAESRGLLFGSAVSWHDLSNPQQVEMLRAHCSIVVPRNALKWRNVEMAPDHFKWSECDLLAELATRHQLKMYGHTLIWHRAPGWVLSVRNSEELRRVMRKWIFKAVTRYKGQVVAWDVVNEPLEYERPTLRDSIFHGLLGESFIQESFEAAHRADPTATLVLNEAHLEKSGANYQARRDTIIKLLARLIARNAPIHAIGIQGHFRPGIDELDEAGFGEFCQNIRAMGLNIFITELDVSCRFDKRKPPIRDEYYGGLFEKIVKIVGASGGLKGVTVWGMMEKYSESEKQATELCPKLINLYDQNDRPRKTLSGLYTALRALPLKNNGDRSGRH